LGAEIESEAEIALDMAMLPPVEEHPKLMVLNKPFLVLLKRRNNPNPYFMARLENEELMKIK